MIIGVTGGIGAGKSSVAGLLGKILKFDVLSADILCRNLLQQNMPGWYGIREKWGDRFFDQNGNIDRPVLRQALFVDPVIRQGVERVLHPFVQIGRAHV